MAFTGLNRDLTCWFVSPTTVSSWNNYIWICFYFYPQCPAQNPACFKYSANIGKKKKKKRAEKRARSGTWSTASKTAWLGNPNSGQLGEHLGKPRWLQAQKYPFLKGWWDELGDFIHIHTMYKIDNYWCWSSNTLATWYKELDHWKRHWCYVRLRAGGEGDDRGWVGWMASLTQWTWVWANSGIQWMTGKPGVLQSLGSQRIGHNLATEQQQQNVNLLYSTGKNKRRYNLFVGWGHKESDMTKQLDWTELNLINAFHIKRNDTNEQQSKKKKKEK